MNALPPGQSKKFDLGLCHTRADTFRLIPDVRRNLAIAAFEGLIEDVVKGSYQGPLSVTTEEVTDVRGVIGGQFDTPVVTPKGARLLLRMLEAGLIPQQAGTPFYRSAPDLAAYAAREDELTQLTAERAARSPEEIERERQEESAARKARITYLAEHPEDAKPEEIKRWLIDQVFIARDGFGSGGTMVLGGMTCHKEINHWISNRGYRHAEITIWWTDETGRRFGDSPYARPINRSARGGENIHKYNRSLRED